ncbi:NAD(P)H-dependent oxidoreductase [Frigoriglobus tundricola]|uniref:Oxygen-insensitive NAD(P)H nitroreductase / Dihydropteridine reductase n=1 Tax=Frigoriglobus tundricola TaxID=2774151 RepID=A0A6M5YP47_9BACT|nr:NAD(P)H-dependent oxidoreductase [Frigoriglobus tundricola]QJW95264.1 Oxygen-insensitive NAD(P)H nitroreductase / Dihydropteridine reductase [Frigoriglobus tundricola]
MPVSPETVLSQLDWRYATKKFDPAKKIAPDLWAKLEQAAIHAPSSFGLQPWKFIVVTDPEVRKQLHPASFNQSQVLDASHLVVFAAKNPPTPADVDAYVARIAEVRGAPAESLDGYKQMMLGSLSRMDAVQAHRWAARQVYIALGVFLSAAALVGVDACPMEGFLPEKYDEILGLRAKGLGSVVIATAGYRSAEDAYAGAAKVRFDPKDVIVRV